MKNTLIDNLKIAVIGGGPVGLTTARLLQKTEQILLFMKEIKALNQGLQAEHLTYTKPRDN
ncbi:MAG: hypothetical protein WKG06_29385 [Segetibacter sp.]